MEKLGHLGMLPYDAEKRAGRRELLRLRSQSHSLKPYVSSESDYGPPIERCFGFDIKIISSKDHHGVQAETSDKNLPRCFERSVLVFGGDEEG